MFVVPIFPRAAVVGLTTSRPVAGCIPTSRQVAVGIATSRPIAIISRLIRNRGAMTLIRGPRRWFKNGCWDLCWLRWNCLCGFRWNFIAVGCIARWRRRFWPGRRINRWRPRPWRRSLVLRRCCFWLWCFWPITATAPRGMVTAVATVAATAAGITTRIVATATAGLSLPTLLTFAAFPSYRIHSRNWFAPCELVPANWFAPWPREDLPRFSIILHAESKSLSVLISDEDPLPHWQHSSLPRVLARPLEV